MRRRLSPPSGTVRVSQPRFSWSTVPGIDEYVSAIPTIRPLKETSCTAN
jgi:hypothetical protein